MAGMLLWLRRMVMVMMNEDTDGDDDGVGGNYVDGDVGVGDDEV